MKNLPALFHSSLFLTSLLACGMLFSFCIPFEEPLFQDDFNDNRHAWTPTDEDGKKMKISDGWLWLPTKKFSAEVYAELKEKVYLDTDFEISFAIKAEKAGEGDYFGIEVMGSNFVKKLHTNRLIVKLTTAGELRLIQKLDDLHYAAKEFINPDAINKGEGTVNELKLTRRGDKMSLNLNGESVLEEVPFSIDNPTEYFHRVALMAHGDKMNVGLDYIYIKYLP